MALGNNHDRRRAEYDGVVEGVQGGGGVEGEPAAVLDDDEEPAPSWGGRRGVSQRVREAAGQKRPKGTMAPAKYAEWKKGQRKKK